MCHRPRTSSGMLLPGGHPRLHSVILCAAPSSEQHGPASHLEQLRGWSGLSRTQNQMAAPGGTQVRHIAIRSPVDIPLWMVGGMGVVFLTRTGGHCGRTSAIRVTNPATQPSLGTSPQRGHRVSLDRVRPVGTIPCRCFGWWRNHRAGDDVEGGTDNAIGCLPKGTCRSSGWCGVVMVETNPHGRVGGSRGSTTVSGADQGLVWPRTHGILGAILAGQNSSLVRSWAPRR